MKWPLELLRVDLNKQWRVWNWRQIQQQLWKARYELINAPCLCVLVCVRVCVCVCGRRYQASDEWESPSVANWLNAAGGPSLTKMEHLEKRCCGMSSAFRSHCFSFQCCWRPGSTPPLLPKDPVGSCGIVGIRPRDEDAHKVWNVPENPNCGSQSVSWIS